MKKRCQECNKPFQPKRSSASFCKESCRINFFQKQKRKQEKRKSFQQKIQQYQDELIERKQDKQGLDAQAHRLQQDMAKAQQVIDYCDQQLSLSSHAFYEQHLQPKLTASKYAWVNTIQVGLVATSILTATQREQQMRKGFINKKFHTLWEVRQFEVQLQQGERRKTKDNSYH